MSTTWKAILKSDLIVCLVCPHYGVHYMATVVSARLDIRCRRCFFDNWCICTTLIFAVVDALLGTNVSATCLSLSLQMLFSLPGMYNCIYILPFLGFKDTSFANLASTSHVFDNVRMLPIKIWHLQFPKIHYRRYRRSISFVAIYFTTWADTLLTKNWYKNSCSDSMSGRHIRA